MVRPDPGGERGVGHHQGRPDDLGLFAGAAALAGAVHDPAHRALEVALGHGPEQRLVGVAAGRGQHLVPAGGDEDGRQRERDFEACRSPRPEGAAGHGADEGHQVGGAFGGVAAGDLRGDGDLRAAGRDADHHPRAARSWRVAMAESVWNGWRR